MTPSLRVMLWRGLLVRCPRCGSGHVFDGVFTMKDQCPRCGLQFQREEGFWLGAFVINFGVGEGLVAVLLMVFLFVKLQNDSLPLAPWIIGGVVLSIAAPVLFFRPSRTIWSAIDLAMQESHDNLT